MQHMQAGKALLIVLGAAAAFAQTPPRSEFEVASIRPTAQQAQEGVTAGLRIDGAQVRCSFLTLKDYIAMAHQVKIYQISGPDWLASDRFDISATLPPGSSMAAFPEMMQRLLEERFQLKMHREKKDFPVYALEVAKGGLKMQERAPESEPVDAKAPLNFTGTGSGQGVSVNLGRGSSYTFSNNRFEAKRLNMAAVVGSLERFMDRPLVDMTDLEGSYDFALDVTLEDSRAMMIHAAVAAGVTLPPEAMRLLDGASLPSLFDAMQKVGLKLDARKAPLDMIVVDNGRKTPTEN